LLSVFDKTGVVDFARGLSELGWELVSSGGTSAALRDAGLDVITVEEVTGSPEMLGDRVKTLHPKIHGGLLADRSNPEHQADVERYGIELIDLVVSNLYPFSTDPSIQLIDIGGPAMVRAAAKNHAHVGIVTDPSDYNAVLDELRAAGSLSSETKRALARKAFAHTAAYDAAIVEWLDDGEILPDTYHPSYERVALELRYGENPHQRAALYRAAGASPWWDNMTQRSGMALSYLNLYDADAAWLLAHDMDPTGQRPAVAIIKHANPCGIAIGADVAEAHRKAHACDPVSAFGGVIAVNRPVSVAMAEQVADIFTEVVVAPAYEDGAVEVLSRKPSIRVLVAPDVAPGGRVEMRPISGGLLLQHADVFTGGDDPSTWRLAAGAAVPAEVLADLAFAWRAIRAVKSNAILLAAAGATVGVGMGQVNRVDAARLAVARAADRAAGSVAASDAFFPFADGLQVLLDAGVRAVVQPGGSVRDEEVIAAAEAAGVPMYFTGTRHFAH
jgi:phosphoribosylaminoimidazolecarboxamide formyltransferase/IMP cyclohydrolase